MQKPESVRLDGRRVVAAERRSLLAIVVLTTIATLAEAGFLVIVTRSGVALTNGDREILLAENWPVALGTALLLAGLFLFTRFISNIAAAGLSSSSVARSTIRLRSAFTDAYLATSWDVKHNLTPGRVQQLLSNYTRTAVNVVTATARGITAIVSLLSLVAVAVAIQPGITLLATALVFVLGIVMVPLRRQVQRASRKAATTQVDFGTRVNETESLALEIEVHGVAEATAERVGEDAKKAADALARAQFAQLAIAPTYQLIAYVAVLGLLAVGANTGIDDIGTVGAVLVLLLRCLSYGQSLQVARAQYVQSDVYATTLADEIERYLSEARNPGSALSTSHSGVEAIDLRFAYDAEPTLRDLNFAIPPGSICGVVGQSGSGKSTLAQLLVGLRESAGSITFDGVAVDDADPRWWAEQIALVPQHSQLLTGTVADNVRFLRNDITDVDIEWACKLAGIHDEILDLGGYQASVGERGGALSGGQRQRLCLARALAGRPRFLVLDEPTSALDSLSERRVLDALVNLGGDTTVVAITHRPAILEICDVVLQLDGGRLAYFGSSSGYSDPHALELTQ